MKPCFFKRKRIAWLAIDALEPRQATELSSHLETCEGCRLYFREVSALTQSLTAAHLATEASLAIPPKRRKLSAALRPVRTFSPQSTLLAQLQASASNWKVVLPALGSVSVVFLILFVISWHRSAPPGTAPLVSGIGRPTQAPVAPTINTALPPTVANYLLVANRSLDQFDDLLTKQAHQPPPPAPVYTVSILALVNASE
jgi:predicted anti-sigma-YlaC factor YlaD